MNKSQLIVFLWKKSKLSFTSFASSLGVSRQLLRQALNPLKTKVHDTNLTLLDHAFKNGYAEEALAFIRSGSRQPRKFKPRNIPKKHEEYSFLSHHPPAAVHVRIVGRRGKIYSLQEGVGKNQARSTDGCFRSIRG